MECVTVHVTGVAIKGQKVIPANFSESYLIKANSFGTQQSLNILC